MNLIIVSLLLNGYKSIQQSKTISNVKFISIKIRRVYWEGWGMIKKIGNKIFFRIFWNWRKLFLNSLIFFINEQTQKIMRIIEYPQAIPIIVPSITFEKYIPTTMDKTDSSIIKKNIIYSPLWVNYKNQLVQIKHLQHCLQLFFRISWKIGMTIIKKITTQFIIPNIDIDFRRELS